MSLERAIELRGLSRPELMGRLGASDGDIERDVAYQGLAPVDRLHVPGDGPADYYLAGDDLRLIYLPRAANAGLSYSEVRQRLGEPAARLRSRAGKRSGIEVFPDRGVAVSHRGEQVEFIEVFDPTTLDAYRRDVYREPPPFKR